MTSAHLLDLPALVKWLSQEQILPPTVEPPTVEPLAGGRSNAMFRLRFGEHKWVLRRPAKVAVERANEGMRREFRILKALEGTSAPHPTPVALCQDKSVLGCVFYLMEEVDGVVPRLEQLGATDDTLSFALVDALAQLHNVDWRQAGLADFGKPEGFHQRQVTRWSQQLASYNGRDIPQLKEVCDWLQDHTPGANITNTTSDTRSSKTSDTTSAGNWLARWEPVLMHADYHIFNVLIAPEPPCRVAAIVDWETATIGDPMLDFVGFWEAWRSMSALHKQGNNIQDQHKKDRDKKDQDKFQKLLARYLLKRNETAGKTTLLNSASTKTASTKTAFAQPVLPEPTPAELRYYGVLYNFRMAVLLEGIYQRSLLDPTRENQEGIGERALFNVDRCQQIMSTPT